MFLFSFSAYVSPPHSSSCWHPVCELQVCSPMSASSLVKICSSGFILESFVYIHTLPIYWPLGGTLHLYLETANSRRSLPFFKTKRAWYMKQNERKSARKLSGSLWFIFQTGNILIFVLNLTKQKQTHLLRAIFSRL